MTEKSNNSNKNNILEKIRSKYIVKRIFENLKRNKLLNIIHYHKMYQKLMKIKLKDYENEFSKIEIEIIPKENTYGKFINYRENAQIYFNDSKEEIKRKKINEKDNVSKIKVILNKKIKSLSELFFECKCIKKIKFIKFNIDDINNMKYMFFGCSSLKELNLFNFNTNNVTDMSRMFYRCSSLKKLNLSNFNTNNVTTVIHEAIREIFLGC